MPVNTPSKEYQAMALKWERCRDAYEGGDAIKAKNTKYLPPLDSHARAGVWNAGGEQRYSNYRERALWYNATARTVDGLAGGIFQKSPKISAPDEVKAQLSDVTQTSESAELFALGRAKEVLTVGRDAILVDMPAAKGARPYWASYKAEDIISFRAVTVNGDEVLTRVVLREMVALEDPNDPFVETHEEIYRVLELTGEYRQTVFRKAGSEWTSGDPAVPLRRGQPLPFIPFTFLSPVSVSPWLCKPPLLDLVDVNISHYRTMADLEHGRHFVALPTPWVRGMAQDGEPLFIGSGAAWKLSENGAAGMLEFTGQGLGALEKADEQKRHMMAVLGARMLEEQGTKSNVSETAAAVGMRHSGEQASLKTLAQALETGLTLALQWHTWWIGTEEIPAQTGARFELNKDFSTLRMSAQDLSALVGALQGGAISAETFYHNLEEGGLARPGVSFEEEKADIESAEPDESATDQDEVVLVDNPYTVLKRNGKYVVVKSDSGKPVPGGEHPTKRRAKKHHAALEAATKDE